MFQLSTDESFHFELLRALSLARYSGSDISAVLTAASAIHPGDLKSWYTTFNSMAVRTLARTDTIDSKNHPVSARDAYFAASTYFRYADFYLHGNKDDPRILELWVKLTYSFDHALALLPIPGKRVTLKADGFDVPAIFYAASGGGKKPTLLWGVGLMGPRRRCCIVVGLRHWRGGGMSFRMRGLTVWC